jgi:hypothetical protein
MMAIHEVPPPVSCDASVTTTTQTIFISATRFPPAHCTRRPFNYDSPPTHISVMVMILRGFRPLRTTQALLPSPFQPTRLVLLLRQFGI